MIDSFVVADETIYKAKSFTDMRGDALGVVAMEQILASANLNNGRSIHVAALARQTIIDAGAQHLGFQGYFLFECTHNETSNGITVLGKATSIEAAMRIIDLWQGH
jgi:hypothetical protein